MFSLLSGTDWTLPSSPSLRLAAFGDANGDKATDLFVLNAESSSPTNTLSALRWHRDKQRFAPDSVDWSNAVSGFASVDNVVASDFDGDGRLDALAMGTSSLGLAMRIVWGPTAQDFLDLPPAAPDVPQPFILDFDGSLQPALLGYPLADPSQLSVWRISTNRTVTVTPTDIRNPGTLAPICKSPPNHSNAFLDLNGDCLADLFVTCLDKQTRRSFFQVWINSRETGFSLAIEQDFPSDVHGPISFADMDADGTMDLVFTTCDAKNSRSCFLNIFHNTQIPLCSSAGGGGGWGLIPGTGGKNASSCRPVTDLCTADVTFNFKTRQVKYALRDILPGDDETIDVNAMPLRLGDYDRDGYPDILILTYDRSARYIRLLQSVLCSKGVCTKADILDRKRAYTMMNTGMSDVNAIPGTKTGAAFFDLYDDGTLDLLVTTRDESAKMNHIYALKNNFFSDGFFLKALMLNGVCPGWCISGDKFPQPKPYGVNFAGATFKYTVTDPSGQKHGAQLSQMPQSSYFALQLPYVFSGLGRTNNYIETLFVGATKQRGDNVATYFGVIPNSQLIVVPYEPKTGDGPGAWKLESFINPSSHAPWVFASLLTTLAVLTGVVIFLNVLERREDEAERRTNIHNINFDAL
ncbi:hypothetical protein BC830DRAFT_1210722 [Chytriomyces sp. MP71]|nr:hypothetical protein BC830DRAFT_1210722 [Chytriomyces sp. MP71]